jgi:hypothetical protein
MNVGFGCFRPQVEEPSDLVVGGVTTSGVNDSSLVDSPVSSLIIGRSSLDSLELFKF